MDAEETIGVYGALMKSGFARWGDRSPRTVCVSRSKTFMAEGSETIFVMYASTALNTSIVPAVFA